MVLLRKTLYALAALWALASIALVFFPGSVESLLGTGPSQHAGLRLLGIMFFTLAMFAVLVAQKIEDVWWWSWAFVISTTLVASLSVLKAAFRAPGSALAWWLLAGVNLLIAAVLMLGLGKAGGEATPE